MEIHETRQRLRRAMDVADDCPDNRPADINDADYIILLNACINVMYAEIESLNNDLLQYDER